MAASVTAGKFGQSSAPVGYLGSRQRRKGGKFETNWSFLHASRWMCRRQQEAKKEAEEEGDAS